MNNIVPQPPFGARQGNWIWNGSNWVCAPDCDDNGFPPFSVLQPGRPSPFFPPPVTQPPWYPGANGGVSFAPPGQPPPNPIRGAFWWDGTSLWLFDGAAWDVVGAGAQNVVTPPGSTFPTNPVPGEQFFDGHTLWIWDGNAWVPVSSTKTYVQATAPPSPNPGDLWFNGTQLYIWSGSAWDIVGPGATVGPVPTTTQVFSIIPSANLAISTAWTIVPFVSTPTIDLENGWNATTKQYMPKTAGNYMFFTRQYYGSDMTGGGNALVKNDNGAFNVNAQANVLINALSGVPDTIGDYMTTSGLVHLNGSTDFVRMWAYSTDSEYLIISSNIPTFEAWLLP